MKYKNVFIFLFIIIILVVGLIFIFNSSLLQQTSLSGTYIQTPSIYYYECAPSDTKLQSEWTNVRKEGNWYSCPLNTNECTIDIRLHPEESYFFGIYVEYEVCNKGGSCEGPKITSILEKQTLTLEESLLSNQVIWIRFYNIFGSAEVGEIQSEYQPFILWKEGPFIGRVEYSSPSQGCIFTMNEKGNLITSSTLSNLITQTSSSNTELRPYETRNFIGPFVPLSTENIVFVDYNNNKGYCVDNVIYKIDTLTTNDEILYIVNTNLNSILAQSPTIECCPGDDEPGYTCENYKWIKVEEGECSLFNPCQGKDFEKFNKNTLVKYDCIDNKCIPSYKEVECTENSVCVELYDSSYACDLKSYTCYNIKGPSPTTPPDIDDESDCKWYEEEYEKGYLFGLITTSGCRLRREIIYSIIIIILIIILYIIYLIKFRRRR